MTSQVESWKDGLIRRMGEEAYNRMQLEKRKLDSGCAVRTLESITGVQATDAEYIQRLEVLEHAPTLLDQLMYTSNPNDISSAIQEAVERDTQSILRLIKTIRGGDTELARALQNLEHYRMRLHSANIRSYLASGIPTAIIDFGHMFHIGTAPDGSFISLSDRSIPARLGEDKTYIALVFTRSITHTDRSSNP